MLSISLGGRDIQGGISWNVYIELGGLQFWAIWMIIGAIAATISVLKSKRSVWWVLLLLPQQAVLTVGALGVFLNLFGLYGDFELSRIIRVLPRAVGFFIFYTIAILDYYGANLWKRTSSH